MRDYFEMRDDYLEPFVKLPRSAKSLFFYLAKLANEYGLALGSQATAAKALGLSLGATNRAFAALTAGRFIARQSYNVYAVNPDAWHKGTPAKRRLLRRNFEAVEKGGTADISELHDHEAIAYFDAVCGNREFPT